MELTKKVDGYEFNCQMFSKKTGKPMEILLLDKKSKFRSGLKYAIKKEIDKIEINLDISQKDIELLKNLPLSLLILRGVNTKLDLGFLTELAELEYLEIQFSAKGNLDLGLLPNLETLNFTAGVDLLNIDKASSLKEFYLWDFKEESLLDFGSINIEKLHIYHSSIESLKGLENCSSIKELRVENCRNLTTLNSLEKATKSIQDLAILNCKNLSDYEALKKMETLEKLALKNCGTMVNTSFLSNLKNLKKGYIDVNIEDGKVDLLMEMPIIFKNYKHFNFKNNLKEISLRYGHSALLRGKEVVYEEDFTEE